MIPTGVRPLPGEEWRPVVGFEGKYLVSNLGRAYSIPRLNTHGGLLKFGSSSDGRYDVISLRLDRRTRVSGRIHRLVADAFIAGERSGDIVRHLNGDSRDNRAVNLAWGTASDNELDKVCHGTHREASKTHCPRGHPYDDTNTVYRYGGRARACRTCRRAWDAARKRKRKGAMS